VVEDDNVYRWDHIFRVRVQHSGFDRLILKLATILPTPIRRRIEAFLPAPFLPPTVIVKTQKEGWDDEFASEVATYKKLSPLQGVVVPTFYGQTRYDGTPAFVLADIQGRHLGAVEEIDDTLEKALRTSLKALANFNIEPADTNLANFLAAGDRVFILDLEQTAWLEPERADLIVDVVANGLLSRHQYFKTSKAAAAAWSDPPASTSGNNGPKPRDNIRRQFFEGIPRPRVPRSTYTGPPPPPPP
jgi:hypothetical protein